MNNTDHIANRLLLIQAARPGTVKMRANPFRLSEVVETLNRLGLRKGFFTGPEQFFYDSVLTSMAAMARILPSTMLAGSVNGEGLVNLWVGNGHYMGATASLNVCDWRRPGMEKVVLTINVQPFFTHLVDLLEEPRELTIEDLSEEQRGQKTVTFQLDPHVVSHLKLGAEVIISEILSISDTQIRDQIFSLWYYYSEAEFSMLHPTYTPSRLLVGNSSMNLAKFINSVPDILESKTQVFEALIYYIAASSPAQAATAYSTNQLKAISSMCSAVFERNGLRACLNNADCRTCLGI